MVKLKREVSASLFRCTHRNSIARSVPDISRMFPDYPGSFLIVITFSVKSPPFPPQNSPFRLLRCARRFAGTGRGLGFGFLSADYGVGIGVAVFGGQVVPAIGLA